MGEQGGFDPATLNWLRSMGLLGGLGGAAGGLASLFGSGKNPANAANKQLDQIPGQVSPYYKPYQQGGLDAYNKLQGEYGNLLGNTGDVYNRLAGGYQESPGYQFKLKQGLQSGTNAAAAGGVLGTPYHQEEAQQYGQGLANQDFEQYLNHQLGLYGQGLEGLGHQSDQGFQANTDYGNLLAQLGNAKAGYGYAGQAGKNAGRSSGLGRLFSGLGMVGGSLFGGPVGGAAGGYVGHLFGG